MLRAVALCMGLLPGGGYTLLAAIHRTLNTKGAAAPLISAIAANGLTLVDAFVDGVVNDVVQPATGHLAVQHFVLLFDLANHFVNHGVFLSSFVGCGPACTTLVEENVQVKYKYCTSHAAGRFLPDLGVRRIGEHISTAPFTRSRNGYM
jgi:hypothetical protein